MSITRFQSRTGARAAPDAPLLHVVTFGCQMNKYDSLLVEGRFKARGYATTDRLGEADVVLFNTCSVRDHAEERAWSWLGELKHAKRERPELVIGVMGCMAQRVQEEVFRRAGHVDIVCGTRRFADMVDLVDEVRERRRHPERHAPRERRILAAETDGELAVELGGDEYLGGRHGWLAVMRGCDLRCSFCVVPTTRGRVRSKPIEEVESEARWMVDQGAQVITLLGQTVNSYGEELAAPGAGEPRGRGRQGRPGTSADERRTDSVPLEVKKERNARLLERAEAVSLRRMQRHLDRDLQVFVEEVSDRDPGVLRGRSLQGLPVSLRGDAQSLGRTVSVTVRQASPWGMSGEASSVGAKPSSALPSRTA